MISHFARQAPFGYRHLALKRGAYSRITSRFATSASESEISIRAMLEDNRRAIKTPKLFESPERVHAREVLLVDLLINSQSCRTNDELQEWEDFRDQLQCGTKGISPSTKSVGVRYTGSKRTNILSKIDTDETYRAFSASSVSEIETTKCPLDPQTNLSNVFVNPEERNKAYGLFKHACQGQGLMDESVRSHTFNLFMYAELARLASANHLFIIDILILLAKILHRYSIKSTYATFMIALHHMRSSSARRLLIGHIQRSRVNLDSDSMGLILAKEDLLGGKIRHQHLLKNANRFDEGSSNFILAFLLDVSPNLAVKYFNNRYVFGTERSKLNSSTVEVFVDFFVPRKRYKELFNVFFFIERHLGLSMNYFLLHTLSGMIMEWSSFPGQLITEPLLLYYHYLRTKRGFKIPKALVARVNERLKPDGGYDKTRASDLIKIVAQSNSYRLTI
ncbi:hypothetical protein KL935_004325 [Ogataea polymorpha]|nr:hypothetical protein KL937_004111 [Ogataea polymorpha]KAG7890114.1 hypothetical protein KL908_004452 [Ogataea polymorpha]KAG7898726.1 hypothetical protein KL935_004325 [Ogataea polymorpha]KAG7933237.1 hypothetical protein KL904_004293 [Ogataea polymorpha]